MVIDRERAFVGSMNLDPRSQILNSEMGVIIDSAGPGREARPPHGPGHGSPANSWEVTRGTEGRLRMAQRRRRADPPAGPQRVATDRRYLVFKLFPPSLY
jgi:phosphatidylserine/phosphatidylglycerophosphate/cardiolipin synthase-like enzyme